MNSLTPLISEAKDLVNCYRLSLMGKGFFVCFCEIRFNPHYSLLDYQDMWVNHSRGGLPGNRENFVTLHY